MSQKCKNPSCDKEVVSVPGRRPKEFCSVECRTKFHNSKNAKGTGRGRPKGSKNKVTKELKEQIAMNNQPENKERIENERNTVLPPPCIPNPLSTDECYIPFVEVTPASYDGESVKKEAIDELIMFGTVTAKTELVDGKATQKVVDKKKIIDDESDWKPKLSPFMLSRQKLKSGNKS